MTRLANLERETVAQFRALRQVVLGVGLAIIFEDRLVNPVEKFPSVLQQSLVFKAARGGDGGRRRLAA